MPEVVDMNPALLLLPNTKNPLTCKTCVQSYKPIVLIGLVLFIYVIVTFSIKAM